MELTSSHHIKPVASPCSSVMNWMRPSNGAPTTRKAPTANVSLSKGYRLRSAPPSKSVTIRVWLKNCRPPEEYSGLTNMLNARPDSNRYRPSYFSSTDFSIDAIGVKLTALVVPSHLNSPDKTPSLPVPVNSICLKGSRSSPVAENWTTSLFCTRFSIQDWVFGPMVNLAPESSTL